MMCPVCNEENDDQLPRGLCQDCWEDEYDKLWWNEAAKMDKIMNFLNED